MTQTDFINKIIGKPWHDRAISFDRVDCWGVVVMYYRHVLGIELTSASGYKLGDSFITCHEDILWQWVDGSVNDVGSMITFYNGDNPNHVGINLGGGKVLHSRGESGSVRIDNMAALSRVYSKMEFRKYASL